MVSAIAALLLASIVSFSEREDRNPISAEGNLSVSALSVSPNSGSPGDPILSDVTITNSGNKPNSTFRTFFTIHPVVFYDNGAWCGYGLVGPGEAQCSHQLEPYCGQDINLPPNSTTVISTELLAGTLCPNVPFHPVPGDYNITFTVWELKPNGKIADRASATVPFQLE